jgi:hypothetical protein
MERRNPEHTNSSKDGAYLDSNRVSAIASPTDAEVIGPTYPCEWPALSRYEYPSMVATSRLAMKAEANVSKLEGPRRQ